MELTLFYTLVEKYPWLLKVFGLGTLQALGTGHPMEVGVHLNSIRMRIELVEIKPFEDLDLGLSPSSAEAARDPQDPQATHNDFAYQQVSVSLYWHHKSDFHFTQVTDVPNLSERGPAPTVQTTIEDLSKTHIGIEFDAVVVKTFVLHAQGTHMAHCSEKYLIFEMPRGLMRPRA